MNAYITELGGADKKWMILGLWTIAAAITRPFSGKMADNISRKSVLYIGVIISIVVSFSYPMFLSVTGFLVLRFIHGFSTGFQPTGATALIADVIPQGKRGEAMGIFGITITLGFSSGLALGSVVRKAFEMEGLFITCGVLGTLSILLIFFIKEDKQAVKQHAIDSGNTTLRSKIIPKRDEVMGKEVMQPSIVMYLYASMTGLYFLLVPDYSAFLGMENKGLFFAVNVIIVIVTRFVAGKYVDKYGARRNLYFGLTVLLFSCFITGSTTTQTTFLLSSLIFGFGTAMISPAIMAWTADLSNPEYKGRGMGTMFIFLELGFLTGNFLGQQIYQNESDNFFRTFAFGAGLCALALTYLIFTGYRDKSRIK